MKTSILVMVSMLAGALISSFVTQRVVSENVEKASMQHLAEAVAALRDSRYEQAIEQSYRSMSNGVFDFEAAKAIGDAYYCLGERRAASITYRIAASITRSHGAKLLLSANAEALELPGEAAPHPPDCDSKSR